MRREPGHLEVAALRANIEAAVQAYVTETGLGGPEFLTDDSRGPEVLITPACRFHRGTF